MGMMTFFAVSIPAVVWQAWTDSDGFGQLITAALILMSIASWAVMLNKRANLKQLAEDSKRFVHLFNQRSDVLAIYIQQQAKHSDLPMAVIYEKTCARFVEMVPDEQLKMLRIDPNAPLKLPAKRINLVECTCRHTTDEVLSSVDKGMGTLAIITSSAPLMGLFGTVWGIMLAFNAMAAKGTALISELAPGVSSALLTTVVGLVVAIPSAIFYNRLARRIEQLTIDIEGFADELSGRISLFYQADE